MGARGYGKSLKCLKCLKLRYAFGVGICIQNFNEANPKVVIFNSIEIIRVMDNKNFALQLETRTKQFAIKIIQLSARLPDTLEGRVVRNQIAKSGTSIGANYREANRSRSRADFKNKVAICESEASETRYWLELIIELKWLSKDCMRAEFDECGQLLALFSAIVKNSSKTR